MRDILIIVGSNEGKNSNSYHIEKYIEKNLEKEAKFTEILLNYTEENEVERILMNLDNFNNIVVISNLRKDELNNISDDFIKKLSKVLEEHRNTKNIYVSFILNGDIETLNRAEDINPILESCNKICKGENIVWQKGIGTLSDLDLWKNGLNGNDIVNEQLILELEMFCQDIKNNKTYHHNSFASPVKGRGILGFLNKKLQQFN